MNNTLSGSIVCWQLFRNPLNVLSLLNLFLPKVHVAKTDLMEYRNSACCQTRSHIFFGHCNIMHDSVTRKIRVLCEGFQYRETFFVCQVLNWLKQSCQKVPVIENKVRKKDFYFAVLANYTVTCNFYSADI